MKYRISRHNVEFLSNNGMFRVFTGIVRQCPECRKRYVTCDWEAGIEKMWGRIMKEEIEKNGLLCSQWKSSCEKCIEKVTGKKSLLYKMIGKAVGETMVK